MSARTRRLAQHADAVRQQPPRPRHITPEARAVPRAFPAQHAKAVDVGCTCGATIYKGEYVVRRTDGAAGSVMHALCWAEVDRLLRTPGLAALRDAEPGLAWHLAFTAAAGKQWTLTAAQHARVEALSPAGWQDWHRRVSDAALAAREAAVRARVAR